MKLGLCGWLAIVGLATVPARAEHVSFPNNFRWCVATAAHQIEGDNINSDMWDWEQVPGHIRGGDKSGAAADDWNRVTEDIGLVKSLGVNTYRMSVEWAKIEPERGKFDLSVLRHYRREVQNLRRQGIRPIVTLHHFTFPRWVAALGGWEGPETPKLFARFTGHVYRELGLWVDDWITINEPMIYAYQAYVTGTMPPGKKGPFKNILPVIRGMLKGHGAAFHRLKELAAQAHRRVRVGVAHNLMSFDPKNPSDPADVKAALDFAQDWNWTFGDAMESGRLHFEDSADEEIPGLKHTQDFVEVNYYSGYLVAYSASGNQLEPRPRWPTNDLGWDIYPQGLQQVLLGVKARWPGRPVMITENGVADGRFDDQTRRQFLLDHLSVLAHAISEGVPVEGYCYWTLMDDFEWADGYFPKFGLYQTDFKTFKRTRRPSADLFEKIVRQNGFDR